jgi:hypothetical protein
MSVLLFFFAGSATKVTTCPASDRRGPASHAQGRAEVRAGRRADPREPRGASSRAHLHRPGRPAGHLRPGAGAGLRLRLLDGLPAPRREGSGAGRELRGDRASAGRTGCRGVRRGRSRPGRRGALTDGRPRQVLDEVSLTEALRADGPDRPSSPPSSRPTSAFTNNVCAPCFLRSGNRRTGSPAIPIRRYRPQTDQAS